MESANEIEDHQITETTRKALIKKKMMVLQEIFTNRPIKYIPSSEHAVDQTVRITDSSSILPIISSLPASGAKPGGISSGQPIVNKSLLKESTIVEEQNKVNSKPFKALVQEKLETNPGGNILIEVKNNLITSCNVDTPVKHTGQKQLQINLFGNKENKPSPPSVTTTSLNTPQVSFSQPQSKLFSFTPSDKNPDKEASLDAASKITEIPSQTNASKSSSSATSFSFKISNNQAASSPTPDHSVQSKSPLLSLSNMVAGFADTKPRISPEKSTSPAVPKSSSANQPFQFSFTKNTQSVAQSTSSAVQSKNLFGGGTQNVSTFGESKLDFSGDSTQTKSIFGGDSTTKSIFGGDNTTKSIFSGGSSTFDVDSVASKPLSVGGEIAAVKGIFDKSPSVAKNLSESDLEQSKGVFGSKVVTDKNSLASDTITSNVFGKDPIQNIFNKDVNVTNSSGVESNLSKPRADLSSANTKFLEDVPTKNLNQNTSRGVNNSSVLSTSGSPKTSFSNVTSTSTKSVVSAEPAITSIPTMEKDNVNTTEKKEEDSQAESSTNLFGSLNIGSVSPTTQVKSGTNLFGGIPNSFGSSKPETTTMQKRTEEPQNNAGFGSVAPATTAASSFNFGVAGASLFGSQSKSETTPTKTDATCLNFGQLPVSAAESPLVPSVPVTTNGPATSFSFSLPQGTATAAPSTFSFAQAATAIPSEDKNTKINLIFGQPSSTPSGSIFGGFGTQPATTSSSTSIFGTSPVPTTSQTSFTFALPTTTTAQTSFFSNKTNVFGTPTATTTGSFFGQSTPATTNSVFGQPSPVFGQAASSPASSPFASSSGFGAKPTFGQSGGSLFGQSSSGGFGNASGTSMFGGGGTVFGSGGNAPGSSVFQSSGTGNLFGGVSNSPGGSFSSGGQSVSQSGFGSPPAFQNKLGGFGSAPTFGAASPPAFGSTPTFGSPPAFGSPSKVFGSSPSVGFGSPTQQSTAFESLANQNTMTFGNLAQNQPSGFGSGSVFGSTPQSSPQQQTGFSSTGSNFSGTSFSSWR